MWVYRGIVAIDGCSRGRRIPVEEWVTWEVIYVASKKGYTVSSSRFPLGTWPIICKLNTFAVFEDP